MAALPAAMGLIICITNAFGANVVLGNQKTIISVRSDVIKIDGLSVYGDLEKPPVLFLHDLHTQTLEKTNQDCNTCHLNDEHYLSLKLMRLKDSDKETVKNLYHDNCQKCHQEMTAAKKKTGPLDCKGCHQEKPLIIQSIQPFGFDKSLHFRHRKKHKNNCDLCHHKYDEPSKTLYFYGKKFIVRRMPDETTWTDLITPGTCRYCHKQKKQINRLSMKEVSHIACIECHRKSIKKEQAAGPVECAGCHDEKQIALIEKLDNIPRRDLKQPDTTIISLNDQDKTVQNRLNPVPFNHKSHEEYNDTCRVCHHARLNQCSGCHTLSGSDDGNNVAIEQAMHQEGTKRSCIGCHEMALMDKHCAGCHSFMGKDRMKKISSCHSCHMPLLPAKAKKKNLHLSNEKEKEKIAALLLESRTPVINPLKKISIPEKVVIKHLSEKYEPVEFPHLKIVTQIVKNIRKNRIANYFHKEGTTLCQGCHHNSPGSIHPPNCGNCHGKPFDERDLTKPGLVGAYHKRCMGCHDEMEIKKPTGCKECHKEKNQ